MNCLDCKDSGYIELLFSKVECKCRDKKKYVINKCDILFSKVLTTGTPGIEPPFRHYYSRKAHGERYLDTREWDGDGNVVSGKFFGADKDDPYPK